MSLRRRHACREPRPNSGKGRCCHPDLQMPLVYSGDEAYRLGFQFGVLNEMKPGERPPASPPDDGRFTDHTFAVGSAAYG
jgi:hypothetical protein